MPIVNKIFELTKKIAALTDTIALATKGEETVDVAKGLEVLDTESMQKELRQKEEEYFKLSD